MTDRLAPADIGGEMHGLIAELYPICRSITGDGVRESLRIIQQRIPLTVHEVPTGTRVFDWTVPKEWNIRDAYIKNSRGERVVDFRKSNLHVVSYSVPVKARMRLEELRGHLHSHPEHPDWIPYRTSYYNENWGFCLPHRQLTELEDEEYEVCIDSTLEEGHLTYGEYYLPGESRDEVLISCHICHPSLCNENLSGVSLVTLLARALKKLSRRYSYRFLFLPTTIGSITWLAVNQDRVPAIKHGLVAACVGDPGRLTYKKSRRGDAAIDRAAAHILRHSAAEYEVIDFTPYGFDERQFCSPGFNLPMGVLTRSRHDCYPEYHTSADNLDLVQPQYLADSFIKYRSILDLLEKNRKYRSLNPHCEPQLGKRGLYRRVGGQAGGRVEELPLLSVLNMSDGNHDLLDIAERSGLDFESVKVAADALRESGLLEECS
jgi:aminopeptidase-like protein